MSHWQLRGAPAAMGHRRHGPTRRADAGWSRLSPSPTWDVVSHQAERTPPTLPLGPGRAERRACAERQRGTLTCIAHVEVAHGLIVAPSMGPTRTAEDGVVHIAPTVASDPDAARWHGVLGRS